MIEIMAKAALYKPKPIAQSLCLPDTRLHKSVHVDALHVNAYNELVGWDKVHSSYLHPNYAQVLSLPMQLNMMVKKPFPFKPLGLVHIANRIKLYRWPESTSHFQIETSFGQLFKHKKGFVFELITKLEDESGINLVASSYYLAPCKCKDFESLNKIPAFDFSSFDHGMLNSNSKHLDDFYFEDNIGRRYAKISGDYNPIHLWPITANLFGFKKAIAHGMMTKAKAFSSIYRNRKSTIHSAYANGFVLDCQFFTPVLLPIKVQLQQTIESDSFGFMLTSYAKKSAKIRCHLKGNITHLD